MSQTWIDDWFSYWLRVDKEQYKEAQKCFEPVICVLAKAARQHISAARDADDTSEAASRAMMALACSYALEAMGFIFAADWCIAELRGVVHSLVIDRAALMVSPYIVGEELLRGWRFSTSDYNRLQAMGEAYRKLMATMGNPGTIRRSSEEWKYMHVVNILCWKCGREADLVKMRISSGFHFSMWCKSCCCYAVKNRPFVSIAGMGIDPETIEEIPTKQPTKPCHVCKTVAQVEVHHLAPYGRFGADADKWPTVEVCRACHELWHQKMGDPIARGRG